MTDKYFAYGSNMNPKRITSRVGGFANRFVGILPDHELAFNKKAYSYGMGYANVIEKPKSFVEGILYDLTEDQIATLDGYEGVASKQYKRESINIYTLDGEPVQAWCYFATNTAKGLLPSKTYLNHLITGAKDSLSESYVKKLKGQKTKKFYYPATSYSGKQTSYLPSKYRVIEPKKKPIESLCTEIDKFEKSIPEPKSKKNQKRIRNTILTTIKNKNKQISPELADALVGMGTTEMKVFVYGTLKQGHGNNGLMNGYIDCEPAMVNGDIYGRGIPFTKMKEEDVRFYATQDPSKDYPAYQKAPIKPLSLQRPVVYGELYTFHNWHAIERLDQLEGFSGYLRGHNLYNRALVTAEIITSGINHNCWIYLAPHHMKLYNKIVSGEWSSDFQGHLF